MNSREDVLSLPCNCLRLAGSGEKDVANVPCTHKCMDQYGISLHSCCCAAARRVCPSPKAQPRAEACRCLIDDYHIHVLPHDAGVGDVE